MKGIITCMTCMFAVSLTWGGPIRRQAAQSEKTVSIGGNFTLLCPFIPDDTWTWVYWRKNNDPIYSLDLQSITPWTNSTRYEVSNHATRLMINDIKKTDGGTYHCKVVTSATSNYTKEGGQVLLSVTDQEVGLSTTSPAVLFTAFTTIPPQPARDKNKFFVFLILIPIVIMCLVLYKYRKQVVCAYRRRTAQTRVTQLPPVGPVLTDDLCMASNHLVADRMRNVLHSLLDLHEGEDQLPKDGKYSFLKEYDWCIRKGVLVDVEYLLDTLGHIPVGRRRDVYEILLTMPEYQQVDNPKFNFTEDMYLEYAQVKAVKGKLTSRTKTLEDKMRSLLGKSETRDTTRNDISTIILYAPLENAGSASSSQYASSRLNQSANQMEQGTSFLPQCDGDLGRKNDNLIKFWLSKLMKLHPKVQRRVINQLGSFLQDADCSLMEPTTDPSIMRIPDAKELNKFNVNENINQEKAMDSIDMQNVDAKAVKISNLKDSTDQEPQPSTSSWSPLTSSQLLSRKQALAKLAVSDETVASQLMELIEKKENEERDKHENKESVEIPGEKENG